jgi:hypothetical protein
MDVVSSIWSFLYVNQKAPLSNEFVMIVPRNPATAFDLKQQIRARLENLKLLNPVVQSVWSPDGFSPTP